ncbi:unnamed protein product [Symbiodinium pilosum]|uniref:Uncharacterized protein n=1 Tax=Symbiodinium pilosum TaxID=2952 RepID=A0A812LPH1_SYMPI|nr:unnamed protein product [Symbiodinium pilosum]
MAALYSGRPTTVRVVHGPVYGHPASMAAPSQVKVIRPQGQWPQYAFQPAVPARTQASYPMTVWKAVPGGVQLPNANKRVFTNAKSLMMAYNFKGDFRINGRPLILAVDPVDSERSHVATGLRAWDGGIVLAKYLEKVQPAARRLNCL